MTGYELAAAMALVLEHMSLLAIILIILKWGFVAAILIGVVIGCTTFALSPRASTPSSSPSAALTIAARSTAPATSRRCCTRMAARSRA